MTRESMKETLRYLQSLPCEGDCSDCCICMDIRDLEEDLKKGEGGSDENFKA